MTSAAPEGPWGVLPRILPEHRLPEGLINATVHKHRENDRVVAVGQQPVFGGAGGLKAALDTSTVSSQVNTSFVERSHGTDRGRNARKARETYRFSKDYQAHEAMTYLTMSGYNFCWPVRTLRTKDNGPRWRERTPAMAAGLTDHVWAWREWFTRPAVQSA